MFDSMFSFGRRGKRRTKRNFNLSKQNVIVGLCASACVCVYVRGHPCETQFTKKKCGQRSPVFKMRAATAATGKRKGGKKNSVTLFIFSFKEQKTLLVFLFLLRLFLC